MYFVCLLYATKKHHIGNAFTVATGMIIPVGVIRTDPITDSVII